MGAQAREKQRKRETEALQFQVPDLTWPEAWKTARDAAVIGGQAVPARPRVSIPSLDQPIQLVLNQEKAAQLGVQIHPLSDEADEDTADVLQGIYRRIEVDSRANLARSFAYERGVKAGTGEYEVTTEYDPDGGSKFDQKIVIKRLLYQGSVVRDPFAQEPDFSDGTWAFKPQLFSADAFKLKYPKATLATADDSLLDTLQGQFPDWVKDGDDGKLYLVAAYYEVRCRTRTVVLLDDNSEAFEDEVPEGRHVVDGHSCDYEERKLWYGVLNAAEWLEEPQERDGRYIPLIPYVGVELIPFDHERRWVGIVEPNMDSVRMINSAASNAIERASLEPRSPWIVAEGQDEGHELEFFYANIRNIPTIHYRPKSFGGELAPPPQRIQTDMSALGPSMALLQQGQQFLHSGTGAFESALGQASPNNKTKGGVLALQQQHEEGNSHFLDNLAEITMTYEAKVILDLIPYIYDRPGRIARILDKEDQPQTVMLNHPFVMDPKSKRPQRVPPGQPMPEGAKHYDLNKGRYGITVDIGKSYKRRADQGADELGQLFQAEPQLFQMLGDIYLKFRDFPGHLEAAERVKKMLPPQLQEPDDPAKAQQQVGQLQAENQQLKGILQKAMEEKQAKVVENQGKLQIQAEKNKADVATTQMEVQSDNVNKQADREVKLAVAELTAKIDRMALFLQERERLGIHEQQKTGHAHELGMLVQEHAHDRIKAAEDHAMAIDQARIGQEHALEQGQQAADLAPKPVGGAE